MRIEENIEGDLKLTTNLVNSGDSYFIEHLLCARCCSALEGGEIYKPRGVCSFMYWVRPMGKGLPRLPMV